MSLPAVSAYDPPTPLHSLPVTPEERVLPLPSWLRTVYFVFPVVLYMPDVIFNYFVYSDGLTSIAANPLVQVGQVLLWAFLSVGVVGMAYLLSVLAPWHWARGNHMQAIFCALGVIVATGITTWNSLAYRSTGFHPFVTDTWLYSLFPQLQRFHISVTMILVAIAPPFWGLFWAVVQPTQGRQTLAQRQAKHAEELIQVQHEAELKRVRAEANAKIREAQLRGMAHTAAAARDQASQLFRRKGDKSEAEEETDMPNDPTLPTLPSVAPTTLPEPPRRSRGTPSPDTRTAAPTIQRVPGTGLATDAPHGPSPVTSKGRKSAYAQPPVSE